MQENCEVGFLLKSQPDALAKDLFWSQEEGQKVLPTAVEFQGGGLRPARKKKSIGKPGFVPVNW